MRIVMGIVWFLIFFIVLYLIYSTGIAMYMMHANGGVDLHDTQAVIASSQQFALQHAVLLRIAFYGVVLLSVLLAVLGTWKRKLPGTKDKNRTETASG